jgi:hypothetical protein
MYYQQLHTVCGDIDAILFLARLCENSNINFKICNSFSGIMTQKSLNLNEFKYWIDDDVKIKEQDDLKTLKDIYSQLTKYIKEKK